MISQTTRKSRAFWTVTTSTIAAAEKPGKKCVAGERGRPVPVHLHIAGRVHGRAETAQADDHDEESGQRVEPQSGRPEGKRKRDRQGFHAPAGQDAAGREEEEGLGRGRKKRRHGPFEGRPDEKGDKSSEEEQSGPDKNKRHFVPASNGCHSRSRASMKSKMSAAGRRDSRSFRNSGIWQR